MDQDSGKGLAVFDRRLAPYILLHGLRGRNPGPPRLAPAGRAGDGLFKAQLVGEACGVFEGVFPLGGHVGEALVDNLRRGHLRVEILEAAQAGSLHPLKIEFYALLRDVPIHPMPPDARLCRFRRIFKPAFKRIGILLGRKHGLEKNQA